MPNRDDVVHIELRRSSVHDGVGRIVSVLLLGAAMGYALWRTQDIPLEAEEFEEPIPLLGGILIGTLAVGALVALYELLARAIAWALDRWVGSPDESA